MVWKNPIVKATLKITITDEEEAPIEGDTVTIGTDEEISDSEGVVEFELAYGDYDATVVADGFATVTEELAFRSNHKNFTIALESASGTGTVTVTCVDSEQQALNDCTVLLSTAPIDFDSQDDSDFVAYGTGENGVATLTLWDTTTHQPTEETQIPFDTYYIGAISTFGTPKTYNGTLTVDGDETVTITLTEE